MRPCPMQLFTLRRSTSCEHLPSLCALNLPAQELVSEAAPGPVESEFDQVAGIEGGATPGQGIFRITAQECAGRYCSGIRESFARNFSWPELSLADENAAPDATTTSRNSCRPSSSPDSLSGNQTRSLRSSPTGHVYAS